MFADNHKISHRQLFFQIMLALSGVLLLYLPGWELLEGRRGILSVGIGIILLIFYSIFLVRISWAFHHPDKSFGRVGSRLIVMLYFSYLILSGIFLAVKIEEIVRIFLVEGVMSRLVLFLCILSCFLGSHQGLQRRGRMAEVCCPVFLLALITLFFLSGFQVNPDYLEASVTLTPHNMINGSYSVFCAFSPFLLLSFSLKQVEKPGSLKKVMIASLLFLGALLSWAFILLQGSFGIRGTQAHAFPMIEMMAGVKIPGNFLQRVDAFWIILIIFSLLFALGSVFFYGHEILGRAKWEKGNIVSAIIVFLGSMAVIEYGLSIEWYGVLLKYLYTPAFFLVCIIAAARLKRRKRDESS